MSKVKITAEQAKEMYKIESLKAIAVEAYPEIFSQEKRWKDFGPIEGYYIDENSAIYRLDMYRTSPPERNTYPTIKEAEQALAMCQLLQWRDKANGEPVEDWCEWDGYTYSYLIYRYGNEIKIIKTYCYYGKLVFKTRQIAEQFLKDHKTLINQAFGL